MIIDRVDVDLQVISPELNILQLFTNLGLFLWSKFNNQIAFYPQTMQKMECSFPNGILMTHVFSVNNNFIFDIDQVKKYCKKRSKDHIRVAFNFTHLFERSFQNPFIFFA